MKKTRITAGIIVVLGIGIYLVAGSYSVLGIITAAFFAMLCMAFYTLAEGRKTEFVPYFPENGEKGQNIEGRIVVENHSWLPVFWCRCRLDWQNLLTGESGSEDFSFAVPSRRTTEIPVTVRTEYRGVCVLSIKKVEYTDPFVLFRRREKLEMKEEITVFPTIHEIPREMFEEESYNMESFRYSAERGGDDTGEVYQVRSYKEGDNLKQIHWKLTARLGDVTVREPGYPISHAVMIFMETGYLGEFPDPDKMDRQISLTLSFLKALSDRQISCQLCFYDFAKDRARILHASNIEEFWQTAMLAVRAGRSNKGGSGLKKFMENAEDWQAGHYIYITAGNEIDEVEYLRESATVTVFDGNMDLQG